MMVAEEGLREVVEARGCRAARRSAAADAAEACSAARDAPEREKSYNAKCGVERERERAIRFSRE